MADTVRQTPDGYLTMAEARARLGVSKVTMAKIVKTAGVATYQDPRDARIKLLKVEDVERMAQPTPRLTVGDLFDKWYVSENKGPQDLAAQLGTDLATVETMRSEAAYRDGRGAYGTTVLAPLGWTYLLAGKYGIDHSTLDQVLKVPTEVKTAA